MLAAILQTNIFLLLILITKQEFKTAKENIKTSANLFKDEINNHKDDDTLKSRFVIKEEINKIFKTFPTFTIPIYISVLDITNPNILNISSSRESYLENYNNLLGASLRVFINENKKIKYNKLIKVFLNKTYVTIDNSNLNEMIIKKIDIENKDYNLTVYFLKNRYMSQYQQINKDNQKLFKFYDFNYVFYKNEKQIIDNIKNNSIISFYKLKDDEVHLTQNLTEKLIEEFILDFNNNKIQEKLKQKIILWKNIKTNLSSLIENKRSEINLYNFMLFNDIIQIKERINNIEKNLLPLLFGSNDKENFVIFSNTVKILEEYLDNYDVSQGDFKIDIYFYFITTIAILIISFLVYKSYKEYKAAFLQKIK